MFVPRFLRSFVSCSVMFSFGCFMTPQLQKTKVKVVPLSKRICFIYIINLDGERPSNNPSSKTKKKRERKKKVKENTLKSIEVDFDPGMTTLLINARKLEKFTSCVENRRKVITFPISDCSPYFHLGTETC